MLVLSRRRGERLVIGRKGQVVIEILQVRSDGMVRVGITADPSIPVHREEVWMRLNPKPKESTP
jgi:carbon storage regulator CsrA